MVTLTITLLFGLILISVWRWWHWYSKYNKLRYLALCRVTLTETSEGELVATTRGGVTVSLDAAYDYAIRPKISNRFALKQESIPDNFEEYFAGQWNDEYQPKGKGDNQLST